MPERRTRSYWRTRWTSNCWRRLFRLDPVAEKFETIAHFFSTDNTWGPNNHFDPDSVAGISTVSFME
jgi:hypothetical protein